MEIQDLGEAHSSRGNLPCESMSVPFGWTLSKLRSAQKYQKNLIIFARQLYVDNRPTGLRSAACFLPLRKRCDICNVKSTLRSIDPSRRRDALICCATLKTNPTANKQFTLSVPHAPPSPLFSYRSCSCLTHWMYVKLPFSNVLAKVQWVPTRRGRFIWRRIRDRKSVV